MKYVNPVVRGFYPDPSVCHANGKYYMVNSTFQYFPGVSLLESEDLVHWKQIGNVLTRKSQVYLEKIYSSGGVFAPTIRYNDGHFYMVTTNATTGENFYVTTDDIHGEWSDPVKVDQGGIDPSLLFIDGRAYFVSNGEDDDGIGGVTQCEIDIKTGKKLSASRNIWKGNGGRFLESPHVYKIGDWFYLMAAEGGTEYGHMITISRSKDIFGPYENCPHNPILTNRNKAPFIIQGVGHGDLIEGPDGNYYIICLGFRQMGTWMAYHQLGREVFLVPVRFDENGWPVVGNDGTMDESYEVPIKGEGNERNVAEEISRSGLDIFSNPEWLYMRHPHMENYKKASQVGEKENNEKALVECIELVGTSETLDDVASPTFVGLRQREFNGALTVNMSLNVSEASGKIGSANNAVAVADKLHSVSFAGVTAFMTENEHYEVGIEVRNDGLYAVKRISLGEAKVNAVEIKLPAEIKTDTFKLELGFNNSSYLFKVYYGGNEYDLGSASAKYLTSEVAGGFTGTLLGMFAANVTARFSEFELKYTV
ncbi:MAG: glycoside hydrolase family 43 protein [Lachnospiraceae bacterium]|nr:glycoside hydrolase family 43 protein [Lachnospiraceae bacterium]